MALTASGVFAKTVSLEVSSVNPPTTIACDFVQPIGPGANYGALLTAIVPHGFFYRVREIVGGTPEFSISTWREMS